MATLRRFGFTVLAVPVFLVLGCGEPSTPTSGPADVEPAWDLLEEDLTTLKRTMDVEEGECASDVPVGPDGGVVECEDEGLRLTIPESALSETVEITVHVPRGDLVGYEFEPHGLTFEKKVHLRQELADTEAEEDGSLLGDLVGAYVEEIDDVVDPLELFTVGLLSDEDDDDDPEALFYEIEHFSGYVCATN